MYIPPVLLVIFPSRPPGSLASSSYVAVQVPECPYRRQSRVLPHPVPLTFSDAHSTSASVYTSPCPLSFFILSASLIGLGATGQTSQIARRTFPRMCIICIYLFAPYSCYPCCISSTVGHRRALCCAIRVSNCRRNALPRTRADQCTNAILLFFSI